MSMVKAPGKRQRMAAKASGTLNYRSPNSSNKRRHLTFLDLPGEIRTAIYELSFPTVRVEVTRAKAKSCEDWEEPLDNRRRLTYKLLSPRGKDHKVDKSAVIPESLPFGLVLASRQIYKETAFYLYFNTQFVFYSTKALKRFILQSNCACQANITSLEIHRLINGEPRLTFFRYFKLKGDDSWERICRIISWSFPGLKELYFNLKIHDWPIELNLDEDWARPILFFGEKGVDHAEVNLRMGMFDENKVRAVAEKLERRLMTEEANRRKDEKEFLKIMEAVSAVEVEGDNNP
ncbi:hypothetical protein FQN54_000612 [Arachnomyces sp. PD_36]|nr:hypothetical protein FQN54_000612 [Arachnomyces sp. PD_36]